MLVSQGIQRHQMLLGMDTEFSTGQMEPTMKVNGNIIKHKAKVHFGTQKAMFIKECSKTIWPMALVNILISMDLNIEENSEMIYKKATEKKNG